jgi:predicted HicB family RNase H-like nuclease
MLLLAAAGRWNATEWRQRMSRTVTLRFDEQLHSKFSRFAQHDNRTLANFDAEAKRGRFDHRKDVYR